MMTDYDEILANVITELTELAHEELVQTDEEYAALQKELAGQSSILQKLKEKLTADDYGELTAFRETESDLTHRQLQASYIRGAKDCVVLLKKLGVI